MKLLPVKIKKLEKITGKVLTSFLPEDLLVKDIDVIEFSRVSLEIFRGVKAADYSLEGCMGVTREVTSYYAISRGSEITENPKEDYTSRHNANGTQDVNVEGETLFSGWVDILNDIKYIVKYSYQLNDWEGGNYHKSISLTVYIIKSEERDKKKNILTEIRKALKTAKLSDLLVIEEFLQS